MFLFEESRGVLLNKWPGRLKALGRDTPTYDHGPSVLLTTYTHHINSEGCGSFLHAYNTASRPLYKLYNQVSIVHYHHACLYHVNVILSFLSSICITPVHNATIFTVNSVNSVAEHSMFIHFHRFSLQYITETCWLLNRRHLWGTKRSKPTVRCGKSMRIHHVLIIFLWKPWLFHICPGKSDENLLPAAYKAHESTQLLVWTLEHAGNMLENYGRSQFFDDLWIYLVFDNKYVYVYNCI